MEIQLATPFEEKDRDDLDRDNRPQVRESARDALGLRVERDRPRDERLRDLRQQIAVGVEQLDRGQATSYDETTIPHLVEKVIAGGRLRRLTRNPP